jgi:glycosyltransferase involved in cell wall biosynthesis
MLHDSLRSCAGRRSASGGNTGSERHEEERSDLPAHVLSDAAERPLRIAQVAPLYEAVPPSGYGGTERVISALCDELVRHGHDVTLFAAAGSRTAARLEPMVPAPLRTTMTRQALIEVSPHLHLQMLAEVFRRGEEFDIVHAHTDIWTFPMMQLATVPTVVTMHGRLDLDTVQRVVELYPDTPLVSISDSQRTPLDHFPMNWVGTCYNGLDLDPYFRQPATRGDYLAFVGRLTPEKRPDWAVEIANRTGLPLRVAAKIDPLDVEYWRDEIEPLFRDNGVQFIGEIGEAEKPAFYATAKALVFPIDWPEPFGLVMIDSLAAGTPVIALRNGSVPEVITHGLSGWICDSVDEMVAAVGRLDELTPARCRADATRFTAAAMTRSYLRVYERVMSGPAGHDVAGVERRAPGALAGGGPADARVGSSDLSAV